MSYTCNCQVASGKWILGKGWPNFYCLQLSPKKLAINAFVFKALIMPQIIYWTYDSDSALPSLTLSLSLSLCIILLNSGTNLSAPLSLPPSRLMSQHIRRNATQSIAKRTATLALMTTTTIIITISMMILFRKQRKKCPESVSKSAAQRACASQARAVAA